MLRNAQLFRVMIYALHSMVYDLVPLTVPLLLVLMADKEKSILRFAKDKSTVKNFASFEYHITALEFRHIGSTSKSTNMRLNVNALRGKLCPLLRLSSAFCARLNVRGKRLPIQLINESLQAVCPHKIASMKKMFAVCQLINCRRMI